MREPVEKGIVGTVVAEAAGMIPERPIWFDRALASKPSLGSVTVAGARITCRRWGPPGPGLVLVHGGLAHARWWDHIAPQLAIGMRVVALDLSGHGDSGWRSTYSSETWADEVLAVAEESGIAGPPIVVGHSLGGIIAYRIAAERGEEVAGIIAIDSPHHVDRPERSPDFGRRTYASAEEALSRFRFLPPDDHIPGFVADYVARRSITRRDDGWAWKFDPLASQVEPMQAARFLTSSRVPTAVFGAQHGFVTGAAADRLRTLLGAHGVVVEIPAAGHHVPLSQPLPLVAGLRTVLTSWPPSASQPRHRPAPAMPSGAERD